MQGCQSEPCRRQRCDRRSAVILSGRLTAERHPLSRNVPNRANTCTITANACPSARFDNFKIDFYRRSVHNRRSFCLLLFSDHFNPSRKAFVDEISGQSLNPAMTLKSSQRRLPINQRRPDETKAKYVFAGNRRDTAEFEYGLPGSTANPVNEARP
jgi:hypothetical protein